MLPGMDILTTLGLSFHLSVNAWVASHVMAVMNNDAK